MVKSPHSNAMSMNTSTIECEFTPVDLANVGWGQTRVESECTFLYYPGYV